MQDSTTVQSVFGGHLEHSSTDARIGVMSTIAGHRTSTNAWALWIVAVACALRATEEYMTGWREWARPRLGIVMPTMTFAFVNAVLVVAAFLAARAGWRRQIISLVIPATTPVNAIFFHVLRTLIQGRVAPGVYTAAGLYLPFSSRALLGAARDGVPRASIATALVIGSLLAVSIAVGARWLGAVPG